jgi:hypothetical protein
MRLKKSPSLQGSWLCRAVRGARPDRNPLRRGTDRLETYLLVGLFAAAAAGAPFAAQAASHACYVNALHVQQEQFATRHQVPAVLTQNAVPATGYSLSGNVLTPATWTSAAGVHSSGEVPAAAESPKGTTVTVWTDDASGSLDSPPLTAAEVASQGDAAMVGTITGIAIAYLAGAGATRQLLNRRRMAAWDADWVTTAEAWNHQSW